MQFQKLYFKNQDGKRLAARLDLPLDEKPTAFAIFAHCFTCTKNFNAVVNIDRALSMHGIAILRFDFTGLGESEGDFSETNFSTNVADLISSGKFSEKKPTGAQTPHRSFAWRGSGDPGGGKIPFGQGDCDYCRTRRVPWSASFLDGPSARKRSKNSARRQLIFPAEISR